MKVVIHSAATVWGGNEKWLLLIARGLQRRGHEVLISCHPRGEVSCRARAAGLRVTHVRPGGDGDLFSAVRFMLMLRRESPDAVLLSAFKRAFWAGWAARRAGVPRIVERMGIEHDLPARFKYQHAFRHYIDALIVNSDVIRRRWLQSAPWFREVHVVMNGVEAPAHRASTLRGELNIPQNAHVISAAGRLEHRKGFDLLLAAVARVADANTHVVITGEGSERETLEAQANRLGIVDRVHLLGFRTDLENVLLGSDLFVLASRKEGMANVMLEAMAAGCLVIATEISGVQEAIGARGDRKEAGWIVPPDNVEAMANAIANALHASPDRVARYRRELEFRVKNWFSIEKTVEHTEEILAGAVSANPVRSGTTPPNYPPTGARSPRPSPKRRRAADTSRGP